MVVHCSTYILGFELVVIQPAYICMIRTVLRVVLYHICTSGYRCIPTLGYTYSSGTYKVNSVETNGQILQFHSLCTCMGFTRDLLQLFCFITTSPGWVEVNLAWCDAMARRELSPDGRNLIVYHTHLLDKLTLFRLLE